MGSVAGIIARGAQPTIEAETPQSIQAKNLAIQNARQGTEMNALKIQQAQRQQASEQAIQKAWQDAGGDLDKTLQLAPQYGAMPDHLIALQQHVLNTKKTIAELDDKALEQHLKHSDIAAGQLNALLQLPEPVAAQQWPQRIDFLIKRGDIKPEELQAAGISPMQYPGHDAANQLLLGTQGYKNQLAQSVADRKVKAEEQQAQARILNAQNTAKKTDAELPGIRLKAVQEQRIQDAQTLAALAKTNPAGLQEALARLSPESAVVFQGLSKPEEFTAAALTPKETAEEADKAAQRGETSRHNIFEERLGAGRLNEERRFHDMQYEGVTLTPEAKSKMAEMFAITGQLPNLGMGKAAAKQRSDIINEAAAKFPQVDFATNKASYQANVTSLKNLQKQSDSVDAFENTAGKNIDVFLKTAKEIIDTGSPVLNAPLRMLSDKVLGSEKMAAFKAARETALTESAKVLESPQGSASLTVSGREAVKTLSDPNATLKQQISAMGVLRNDMRNRKQSNADAIKAIQDRIGGKPPETPAEQSKPAAATYKVGDSVMYQGKAHKITSIKSDGKLVLEQ